MTSQAPSQDDVKPFTYKVNKSESVSEAVITAVSACSEYEPLPSTRGDDSPPTLDPLYSVIDPDALDTLFNSWKNGIPQTDGKVRFTLNEHTVTVYSYGLIRVHPPV